jgi:putative membrane protein
MPSSKYAILPDDPWNRCALVVFLTLWFASCVRPPYPEYLLLQHGPTLVTVIALAAVQNRIGVSRVSYTLILLFMAFHLVGGRYLYSNVPYDDWSQTLFGVRITDAFNFQRNHYDRLVHFLFGLLVVIPSWRFGRRILRLGVWWSAAVAFSIIMTASAVYELLEWSFAMLLAPEWAESYNGQQGDVWDPHWDMALAGLGSLVGLGLVAVIWPLRRSS